MSYHYTDSGLDTLYLENGVHEIETPYGTGVSIDDVHGLHAAIGLYLIEAPVRLTGAELRFLRIEMELGQRALADLLGSGEQNIRRYEKARSQAVPGPIDHLMRAIYAEHIGVKRSLRRMVERLADPVQTPRVDLRLRATDEGWTPAELVRAA